VDKAAAAWR